MDESSREVRARSQAVRRELRRRALERIRGKLKGREEERTSRGLPESGPPDPRIPEDVWRQVKRQEEQGC